MDAPDTGPEHISCAREILPAVHCCFDFAAQNEVCLFIGMVVQADRDPGQILDEEQSMVSCPEFFVYQPLQKHALQTAGDDASLISWRNLSDVEVSEQIAVEIR